MGEAPRREKDNEKEKTESVVYTEDLGVRRRGPIVGRACAVADGTCHMDDRASSAEEGWLRARAKDDASWGSRGRSAVGAYGNGHPCRRSRKAVCWRREVEHAGVAGGTVIEMKTRGISVRIRIRIRLASSHLCIVVASVVMLHQEGDDGTGGGRT